MQLFHRLLYWGWWFLYTRDIDAPEHVMNQPVDGSTLPPLPLPGGQDNAIFASVAEDFCQADESREIMQRRERVRARKAGEWMRSTRMIPDLLQVVVGISPNESYLHFLLQEHAESTWTGQYGLQWMPLVQLAQPGKSPAVRVLDRYWQLQNSSIDCVMDAVVGYSDINLAHERTLFFQMLLDMSSSVWWRQVRKHQTYPWLLAVLLDSNFPVHLKEERLNHFFATPDCCLEEGCSIPLKKKYAHMGDACLDPGSMFMKTLVCMMSSKTTNVELENNFARSSTGRSYLHGKRHFASTMSCKHLLSELKHQHLLALQRDSRSVNRKRRLAQVGATIETSNNKVRLLTDVATSIGTSSRSELHVTQQQTDRQVMAISKTMASNRNKRNSNVNGWSLCLKDCFAEQPVLPGESNGDRYNRVRQLAAARIKDPAVKSVYSDRAKAVNKDRKMNSYLNHNEQGLLRRLSSGNQMDKCSIGPWGIGDQDYPISLDNLKDKVSQRRFVHEAHSKFCKSYGGLVDDASSLESNHVLLEKFCSKLGGCYHALDRDQKHNVLKVIDVCKNLARLHRGRSAQDPAFLLLLVKPRDDLTAAGAASALSDANLMEQYDSIKAYFICQVMLNPLQLCLWQCRLMPAGGANCCEAVWCPKEFTAMLDCSVVADATSDCSQMMPKIKSMFQVAYEFKDTGFEGYNLRVIKHYDVVDLCSIHVANAAELFTSVPAPGSNAEPFDQDADPNPTTDGDDVPEIEHNGTNDDAVEHCISLLKASSMPDAGKKKRNTSNTQKTKPPSDQPRLRKTAATTKQLQSSCKMKTTSTTPGAIVDMFLFVLKG